MQIQKPNSNAIAPPQSDPQLVFPYTYGSLSFSMGKKSESSFSHKWICFVRGPNNQDMSYLFKKVVFKLHDSFENNIREIHSPPYQIQEFGWGEFEIAIELHFNHPDMPTVQMLHMLRLNLTHQGGGQSSKKPLCAEVYDEIVFAQRDVHILLNNFIQQHIEKILQKKREIEEREMVAEDVQEQNEFATADQPLKSITQYTRFLTHFEPDDHAHKLEEALRFIKGEISNLQEKMRSADVDMQKVYEELYGKYT